MFSDKNYGLPKDLIEAAKKVHEKQLEEGAGKYAEPRIDPKIHKQKNQKVKDILHDLAGREKEEMNKKLPGFKKPQAEEVQFTEEELVEAFAIFLEENFHVDMLTEEDLDYVFEEEFPQWLDMIVERSLDSSNQERQLAIIGLDKSGKTKPGINTSRDRIRNVLLQQRRKREATVRAAKTGVAKGNARDLPQYLPHRSKIFQGNTEGGNTSAPKATPTPTPRTQVRAKPTPAARNQVSSKPAASARKRTSAPKGSFTAYRKSLGLGGNLKAAQSERYKKAYRRFKERKSPKKNWSSAVFEPQN